MAAGRFARGPLRAVHERGEPQGAADFRERPRVAALSGAEGPCQRPPGGGHREVGLTGPAEIHAHVALLQCHPRWGFISRSQPFQFPCFILQPCVEKPVVEPVSTTQPELEVARCRAKAAPEGRHGHAPCRVAEALFVLVVFFPMIIASLASGFDACLRAR